MGATMTGIIEWTNDAQCAATDLGLSLGAPRWDEDFLHGVLFTSEEDYDFFAAIAGARNRFGKPPLIPPRGFPANLSLPATRYFEDFGDEMTGWLHLSEIEKCIQHMDANPFYLGFENEVALELMNIVVSRLSDPHVRLVFNIEGP